jgi:hypothetical protein
MRRTSVIAESDGREGKADILELQGGGISKSEGKRIISQLIL